MWSAVNTKTKKGLQGVCFQPLKAAALLWNWITACYECSVISGKDRYG